MHLRRPGVGQQVRRRGHVAPGRLAASKGTLTLRTIPYQERKHLHIEDSILCSRRHFPIEGFSLGLGSLRLLLNDHKRCAHHVLGSCSSAPAVTLPFTITTTYVHIQICTKVYIYMYIYLSIYISIYLYLSLSIYIYIHTYTCMHIHMYVCM